MDEKYTVKENQFGTSVEHPSYGTLLFARRTGGATPLFGSSIEHRDTIAMTLYHAEVNRGLYNDTFRGKKAIAEVEMSYSQFAEAITSMNMGTGVPVTIRYTEKDGKIPACDFVSKRNQFVDEFKEKRKDITKQSQDIIREVSMLFSEKKSLTKADRQDILRKLSMLNNDIGVNTDFMFEQFNEQMDKTVAEAKGEVEAFCQNKINQLASAKLVEMKDTVEQLESPIVMPLMDAK